MDISHHEAFDARLLDTVARAALGNATCGISTGADSRIHLLAKNLPQQQRASDLLSNFGMLRVTASATALTVGAADPAIVCRDEQIAADERLGYVILRSGEETRRGSLDVSEGDTSLFLSQPIAGLYTVFLYRLRGNFASGSVEIRVNPA